MVWNGSTETLLNYLGEYAVCLVEYTSWTTTKIDDQIAALIRNVLINHRNIAATIINWIRSGHNPGMQELTAMTADICYAAEGSSPSSGTPSGSTPIKRGDNEHYVHAVRIKLCQSGGLLRQSPITRKESKMYNTGMKEIPERVYVDSSVMSGMFDSNDHPVRTKPFWDAVFIGKIRVVLSDVLDDEIANAPQHVLDFYKSIPETQIERIVSTDESDNLAEQYVVAGIVGEKSLNDCRHVALAAVAGVDVLVSFNCRHIVKLNRIRRYNAINMLHGYPQIEIRTPDEVIYDEI